MPTSNRLSNPLEIKEVDNIVAIEILLDTFGIDVLKWNKKQVKEISNLLLIAAESRKVREE